MANHLDHLYFSLLGSAENFRRSNPPNIKLCLQCLHGILRCKLPPVVEARTHLQIASLLLKHAKSSSLNAVHQHLDKAWTLAYHDTSADDIKFESSFYLAEAYKQQGDINAALSAIQRPLELPHQPHTHFWRCWLLFHQAELFIMQKNYPNAYQILENGRSFCHSIQSQHTEILFLLSKGLVALLMGDSNETNAVMPMCGQLITAYQGSQEQQGLLKIFFLVLQVSHYLTCGMSKSVKPLLRQLQDSIQAITQTDDAALSFNPAGGNNELFQWMSKEHLCILVYLITAYHMIQGGYLERAQQYTEKALSQINTLKTIDDNSLLSSFQVMLLENIIMCHISFGDKHSAIKQISELKSLQDKSPVLRSLHSSQLHTLIGLYAMSMNCVDQAISQLQHALTTCSDPQLWTFINLNLGIVYARTNRTQEFMSLLEHIHPHRVPQDSFILKASASYVNALQAFFSSQYQDANYKHPSTFNQILDIRRIIFRLLQLFLQETLKLAATEDLNKLTACGLVLLGQVFLNMNRPQEVAETVIPAMQLAQKIPDVNIQLWGTSLLKDMYRMCGDYNSELQQTNYHSTLTNSLISDHFRSAESPEHQLIQWLGDLSSGFHSQQSLANHQMQHSNGSHPHNGQTSNMPQSHIHFHNSTL